MFLSSPIRRTKSCCFGLEEKLVFLWQVVSILNLILVLSLLIHRYHDRGNQFWEKLCTAEFRELYALGAVRNDLYVIGGQMKVKNQYLITNCVDKYSVERDTWKRVSPLPLQLACHAVVTVKDKLYVIGGWTPQVRKAPVCLLGMAALSLAALLKNTAVVEY